MLKTENSKKLFSAQNLPPLIIAAFSVLLNGTAVFFLPEKLTTGIELLGKGTPTTDRGAFVVIATCMLLASCAMCIFSENRKKWLALSVVLLILDVLCIVLNLI